MPTNPLEGFGESTFTADRTTRPVCSAGSGPVLASVHAKPTASCGALFKASWCR